MPFTKNGTFCCPGCGAKTVITRGSVNDDILIATIELVINHREQEASPEGDLRPKRLSEGIDAKAAG